MPSLYLSQRQHALAGNLQVVRHFHHARLQRKRAALLESVAFRVHHTSRVGADRHLDPQPLPHRPLAGEELSEPVAVDASLAMEEPHEIEEVATQARARNADNDSVAREIARTTGHITIHEKISPGAVVGEEHCFSRLNRVGLLHGVNFGSEKIGYLQIKGSLKSCLFTNDIRTSLTLKQAYESITISLKGNIVHTKSTTDSHKK